MTAIQKKRNIVFASHGLNRRRLVQFCCSPLDTWFPSVAEGRHSTLGTQEAVL